MAAALVWGSRPTVGPPPEMREFGTGMVLMSRLDPEESPVEIPGDQLSEIGLGPALAKISWTTYRGQDVLLVTTFGSGACPTYISHVEMIGPQAIRLGTGSVLTNPREPGVDPALCTWDLAPSVSMVEPPADISPTERLTVEIDGFDLTVPPSG
ncbi:hypothetical protein GIS00_02370 [Nakamurella sp. YIM 132087]|uniref:Uncharacterized protein n=1 Tax=Nakamurella alba TaxID=2665158 RepID=A0A7K1FH52_9ACTN|nr:hypothetical protein [Nakamurella alba]MTD12789.1 hypothetical protein [Nakamurella alba]